MTEITLTTKNFSTKAFLQDKNAGLKRFFHHPVLDWRAIEASETLSGLSKFELLAVRCMYVCRDDVCHNSSACFVYVFLSSVT